MNTHRKAVMGTGVLVGVVTLLSFLNMSILGLSSNLLLASFYALVTIDALFTSVKFSKYATLYCKGTGVLFIVLGLLGFMITDLLVSLFNINVATNIFHLFIGISIASIGFGVDK